MEAKAIVEKFGGQSALARMIGKRQTTVAYWVKSGIIPAKWQGALLALAEMHKIELSASDFVSQYISPAIKIMPAGMEHNEINDIDSINSNLPATIVQGRLDLGIDKHVEMDGVGMGVLTDGTAFLTGRGLARLTGVHHSQIQDIAAGFEAAKPTPRSLRVREIMESHGTILDRLYIPIQQRSGIFFAFPDAVCISILEYYAFDAANRPSEAIRNYRLLAGKALRDFIYTQVGYDPNANIPGAWKQFHDRVSLTYNAVPHGYFGIFKEMSDMIVTLGQAGLHIDDSFLPDISVGIAWSKHWNDNGFGARYGERKKFEHNYPSYFPQAKSNPQEPWCYPENALGEFRRWLRENYIKQGKFKNYLEHKVKERALPVSFAQIAIAAYKAD